MGASIAPTSTRSWLRVPSRPTRGGGTPPPETVLRDSGPARDHRRFAVAMDVTLPEQLPKIERRESALVVRFGLDLSGLVLDTTNFAT